MRSLLLATVAACALAPMLTLASPQSQQSQQQGQGQEQAQQQAQGQKTNVLTTTRLNQLSAAGAFSEGGSGTGGTGTGNVSTAVEGDEIGGSWGFSYYDAEAAIPQAVVEDGTIVTSYRLKVGPLFGWSGQVVHYLPSVVSQYANTFLLAWGVDLDNPHPSDVAAAYKASLCLFVGQVKDAGKLTRLDCSTE